MRGFTQTLNPLRRQSRKERAERKRESAERKHFCWRGEEQLHQKINKRSTNESSQRARSVVLTGAVTHSCLLYLPPHKGATGAV